MNERKVLIVDDEVDILNLVKMLLKANGYTVAVAADGKEALKLVKTFRPQVILLDIMMPEMDGGDVVRELKKDPMTSQIPVIFLTAILKEGEGKKGAGVKIGDTYYPGIAKPFENKEILAALERIFTS